MKRKKQIICFAMAALLGMSQSSMAFAETPGPGVTEDPYHGYGEEKWAQLSDNVLEYDELFDLIGEFNPSLGDSSNSIQSNFDLMSMAAQSFSDDSQSYKEAAEQSKQEQNLKEYAENIYKSEMSRKQAEGLRKAVKVSERVNSSTSRSLRKGQKMLTNGAQQMMIGYSSAVSQRATLAKMKEMYAAALDAARTQVQQGTATQADVMAAQTNLLSAESMLLKLDSTINSLRSSLCLMTGWSADATPEIRMVPAADMNRIASLNLEEDITKAIGNNYTLISQRHTTANSTSESNNRTRLNEEGEQKLRIEMESLYQDVLLKKSAYESSDTAFQSAVLAKNAADRQYQLGMISRLQYLGLQASYLQAEGAKNSAQMDLVQALQVYDQAVDGFATIE